MRLFNYLQACTLFRILEGWGLNIFRISGHCNNIFILCRDPSRQNLFYNVTCWLWGPPQTHCYALWYVSANSWGDKDSLFVGYATVRLVPDFSNYCIAFTFRVKPSDLPEKWKWRIHDHHVAPRPFSITALSTSDLMSFTDKTWQ